jgi:site-specific DNA-cytosine methylase
MRAPDGLAGRLDGGDGLANAIAASAGHHGHSSPRGDGTDNLIFVKAQSAHHSEDNERWERGDQMKTLDAIGLNPRTATAIIARQSDGEDTAPGLDSHRYRCCGNGVVANVAEWLGWRLRAYIEAQP